MIARITPHFPHINTPFALKNRSSLFLHVFFTHCSHGLCICVLFSHFHLHSTLGKTLSSRITPNNNLPYSKYSEVKLFLGLHIILPLSKSLIHFFLISLFHKLINQLSAISNYSERNDTTLICHKWTRMLLITQIILASLSTFPYYKCAFIKLLARMPSGFPRTITQM